MPRAKTEAEIGMAGWKVRVVVGGAILHVFSKTEPVVRGSGTLIDAVEWTVVEGTEYGDTVGFIRWADVSAVTWRHT